MVLADQQFSSLQPGFDKVVNNFTCISQKISFVFKLALTFLRNFADSLFNFGNTLSPLTFRNRRPPVF
jgi:hypothetical protein